MGERQKCAAVIKFVVEMVDKRDVKMEKTGGKLKRVENSRDSLILPHRFVMINLIRILLFLFFLFYLTFSMSTLPKLTSRWALQKRRKKFSIHWKKKNCCSARLAHSDEILPPISQNKLSLHESKTATARGMNARKERKYIFNKMRAKNRRILHLNYLANWSATWQVEL